MWWFKHPKSTRPRLTATISLVFANWLFSVSYRFPEQLVQRFTRPSGVRVSIVQYLETLGPVWIVGFSLAAIAMTYAVISRRALVTAHVLGGMIWAGYSTALLFGVFASNPIGSILLPGCAVVITVFHLSLSDAYSENLPPRKEKSE